MLINCSIADVQPYVPSMSMPWDRRRAIHLYRRMTFGANATTIVAALDEDPLQLVDNLIAEAQALPLTPEPDFAFKDQSQYGLALLESVLEKDGYTREWILALQGNGLRGRMAFFWHNHFVTKFDIYESSNYTWQYHKLLQEYALGDFKAFVREMGLTPAMLVFLNGSENFAGSPNENYARELFELFTLGDNNGYTQTDIEETARALTGYTDIPVAWGPINFDPTTHDDGVKTIFGQTGNWGYDDVIDILFEQRASEISGFIAGKLYARFVNPTVDQVVVDHLAQVFRQSDWSIAALVREMFRMTHFYDLPNISTIIEGPLENNLILYNELGNTINGLTVFGIWSGGTEAGQEIFNPVDVAGWPGNRSWINTTTIATRWSASESLLGVNLVFGFGELGELARAATEEEVDVEIICQDIIHYFLPQGLQFESDFEAALVTFKGDVPPDYFTNGNWDIYYWALPFQMHALLLFLAQLPEFQLK
ncbi:MAG: DUF1800 domain-containing protein [Bacteroidota bacterium]